MTTETRLAEAERLLAEAREALRFTREYVGEELLYAGEGWGWYDSTVAITAFLADNYPIPEPVPAMEATA